LAVLGALRILPGSKHDAMGNVMTVCFGSRGDQQQLHESFLPMFDKPPGDNVKQENAKATEVLSLPDHRAAMRVHG
jgi:hypothetical protein